MASIGRLLASAMAAALLLAANAQAAVITSSTNNPYSFTWSYTSAAGPLTGSGSMTLSGFNSSILTFNISLSNTSALLSNRLTSFGFGIDPNATGVHFQDANDGGMVDASLANIPGLATVEVCAFGGNNCSGGANGGISGTASDSFSLVLNGTWGSSVNIYPIGFKYQTGLGSFEFTTDQSCTNGNGCSTNVPAPGSLPITLFAALSLLGLSLARAFSTGRRRSRIN